ncbi:PIG-L family deacetylase [uncultured Paludibaculum sp.]|uniref:PIG-L family deacetylase n=1 Tax=uncultured Paludibaculum sp. TaxID=1765020 RepID=UPI002AABD430|nr:PIG-L family deacetylase [uncultured Paludibaculum sp.]
MTKTRVQCHSAVLSALLVTGAVLSTLPARGEVRKVTGAAALEKQLERLRVVGSVLMIAAHPDDENTALLAYCAQGRKFRTAYLSLTRGEGGQNLIGSEQGDLLGVIRTQELLAARRVDGAEQFFSRAIDFGFSKTADETLQKWGRDKVLSDVVWVIRKYRPDVIFLRFSGTPRDGHGHHQSSSILGKEAFKLAADPKAFPEQLKYVQPWQAKRIMWNGFSFNRQQEQEMDALPQRLMVDTGDYDAVLGLSYGELAGISRSQHRSQGMGSPERKGAAPNYLILYGGEPATKDFMEGVDISWSRLPGGAAVQKVLDEALAVYSMAAPEKVIAPLLKARKLIVPIDHPDARRKLSELDEAVAMAAGLWLEVGAAKAEATPGGSVTLDLTAVSRGRAKVELEGVKAGDSVSFPGTELAYNKPYTAKAEWKVPENEPLTQPLQLREPKSGNLYTISDQRKIGLAEDEPVLTAVFRVKVEGETIEIRRPVENRYVDHVRGELSRPFVIVPPVSLRVSETALLFSEHKARPVSVEVVARRPGQTGSVSLQVPAGWQVTPAENPFQLADAGQMTTVSFEVTPPAATARGEVHASAHIGNLTVASGMTQLNYDHIPLQTVFPAARTPVVRVDAKISAKRIGYVMGAGDEVPAALRELGCDVTFLGADDLARGDLGRFDAIVTGVRAFNVREDLRASRIRLQQYMEAGGTVVVQYNIMDGPFFSNDPGSGTNMGPYPFKLSRNRTTVEEAPVQFLKPDDRLLQIPNTITQADFDGWVQERALYFPSEWDSKYTALLETHDPGEAPNKGGLLYARVGKGAYIYTCYDWFRELPAGVPGAYRIFANLVSASR